MYTCRLCLLTLFLDFSFVLLSSPELLLLPLHPPLAGAQLSFSCNGMVVVKEVPHWRKLKAQALREREREVAPVVCVMQGHQTASSFSAWLLCFTRWLCLPPLSFLSQYSTHSSSPKASLISRIRYSFKKTHSTWLSAQTTLTQGERKGGGGRNRRRTLREG